MSANTKEPEYDLPEIVFFRASDAVVEKREAFSLQWEVTNAVTVEIFKNGMPFLKRNADEKSVVIHETYDGKDKDVKYTLTAVNEVGQIHSLPVTVRITDVLNRLSKYPEIIYFETSASVVQNKEPFTLSWESKNTTHVDLYRNGLVYKKYGTDTTSVTIVESYDGRDKDISYSLLASNNKEKIESDPLTVSVREKIAPDARAEDFTSGIIASEKPGLKEDKFVAPERYKEPDDRDIDPVSSETYKDGDEYETTPVSSMRNQVPYADEETPLTQLRYQERRQKNLGTIRMYLWGILLIIVVALVGIIYFFQSKTKILDFDPKSEENHTIVIVGRNFPADSNNFQILFNNIKGSVQYNSKEIIRVIVPFLGDQKTDDSSNIEVELAMVYKGDTLHAGKKLLIVRKIKENIKVGDSTSSVSNPALVMDSPVVVMVDKTKKVVKTSEPPTVGVISRPPPKNDTVLTEKKEEIKKPVIDIYKLVHASPGDYNKRLLGGVKGLKITVVNESDYQLDNVAVTVNYLKGNEREVKKEEMNFPNVKAHSSSTLDGSRTNRGSKVTCNVTSISSKALDSDLRR